MLISDLVRDVYIGMTDSMMNDDHLKQLLVYYDIGSLSSDPIEIFGSRGGSRIWKVTNANSSYAIKQLSSDLDCSSQQVIKKYELTETLAERFKSLGIPAVSAMAKDNRYLIALGQQGYLLYPWVEGKTLSRYEVSLSHANTIAKILAKIHGMKIELPNLRQLRFDRHSSESLNTLFTQVIKQQLPYAHALCQLQAQIHEANQAYHSVIPLLEKDTVLTHGDLDQMNVIWSKDNQPSIVDWETVRYINQTRDVIRTCLSWSGFGGDDFSFDHYQSMINHYLNFGGRLNLAHVRSALISVYGSMIHWLTYNMQLSIGESSCKKKARCIEEIFMTLKAFSVLNKSFPDLIRLTGEGYA
mgnify:CR=1 FL=1